MKAIPADVQKQISELAAVVDDKADEVRLAVEAFNDTLAIEQDALERARRDYNAVIADLRGVYEDLCSTAQTYFDERSDRWRDGDAGIAYDEWVSELAETAEQLAELEPFDIEEVEEPELFDADQFVWPDERPTDV